MCIWNISNREHILGHKASHSNTGLKPYKAHFLAKKKKNQKSVRDIWKIPEDLETKQHVSNEKIIINQKYIDLKENENTIFKFTRFLEDNLQQQLPIIEGNSQISDTNFYLKKSEKKSKLNPKEAEKKEAIRIRLEITEIKIGKQVKN